MLRSAMVTWGESKMRSMDVNKSHRAFGVASSPARRLFPERCLSESRRRWQTPSQGGSATYHTVCDGETLHAIAKKYGVGVQELRELNWKLLYDRRIRALRSGIKKFPKANFPDSEYQVYVPRETDALSSETPFSPFWQQESTTALRALPLYAAPLIMLAVIAAYWKDSYLWIKRLFEELRKKLQNGQWMPSAVFPIQTSQSSMVNEVTEKVISETDVRKHEAFTAKPSDSNQLENKELLPASAALTFAAKEPLKKPLSSSLQFKTMTSESAKKCSFVTSAILLIATSINAAAAVSSVTVASASTAIVAFASAVAKNLQELSFQPTTGAPDTPAKILKDRLSEKKTHADRQTKAGEFAGVKEGKLKMNGKGSTAQKASAVLNDDKNTQQGKRLPPRDAIDRDNALEDERVDKSISDTSPNTQGSLNGTAHQSDRKSLLLDKIYNTARGLDGTQEQRGMIEELLTALEGSSPNTMPTNAMNALEGHWKLIYTTNSQMLMLLNSLRRLPIITIGDVYQIIDGKNMTAQNKIDISVPFLMSLNATSGFEIRTPRQFKVRFLKVGLDTYIQTPQLFAGLEIPDSVSILGTTIDLKPLRPFVQPINTGLEAAQSLLNKVVSPELPIANNEQNSFWLLTTYLDDTLRISRDAYGKVFVLIKDVTMPLQDLKAK